MVILRFLFGALWLSQLLTWQNTWLFEIFKRSQIARLGKSKIYSIDCWSVSLRQKISSSSFFLKYFPVPSVAPGQVLVTAQSSKSLHVSWTAVPQKHHHGKIHMHKIYISLATQPSNYINSYFAFNPVEYNISDLRVFTLYVIRVSAVNEAGEGPKSRAVTARTLEGGEFIHSRRK